jgi:hypothetical protein
MCSCSLDKLHFQLCVTTNDLWAVPKLNCETDRDHSG